MEKYYCENCRSLHSYYDVCQVCGDTNLKKIWIEVQNQEGSKNVSPE